MSKVRVNCFAISLDGYGAGPQQSLENPLGVGGMSLHEWFFPTRTFQSLLLGKEDGETGIDDQFAAFRTSAPGYSAGICLVLCAVRGRTIAGKAGGATIRHTTFPFSY
jgi:hypothetical protein